MGRRRRRASPFRPFERRSCLTVTMTVFQESIAMLDRDGAVIEKMLKHEGEAVREFHASIPAPVVVGTVWISRWEGAPARIAYDYRGG
jgi:hypothetical protein